MPNFLSVFLKQSSGRGLLEEQLAERERAVNFLPAVQALCKVINELIFIVFLHNSRLLSHVSLRPQVVYACGTIQSCFLTSVILRRIFE